MDKVTIKDIARELGISIATVSRVLNNSGYASEEVRQKVINAAKEMNYQPNAIAKSLKNQKTNTIGVLVPDISNPYFITIAKGIEDVLEGSEYSLIFASSDEDQEKEKKMVKILLEKRVDALVLATSGQNKEIIETIKQSNIPVTLVDRKIPELKEFTDLVVEDNVKGAFDLTNYLIETNHQKIGVVTGSLKVSTGIDRFEGFKKAMETKKIKIDSSYIFHGNYTVEDGKAAVDYFWEQDEKPTALLSFNNTMAMGMIEQLTENGQLHKDGLVIASYGQTGLEKFLTFLKIINVVQSPYEMGKKVGALLIGRLSDKEKKGPKQICFPPKYSFRGGDGG